MEGGDELRVDGVGSRSARPLHEFRDVVFVEPLEANPHDVVGATKVGEGVGQLIVHFGVVVPEGREDQQARVAVGLREVSQEQERRRVGPVAVLHDEEDRLAVPHPHEEVTDRGVEPVPLGVGVRGHGRG